MSDWISNAPVPLAVPIAGRCPSWSPGNELKCFGSKGHPGDCWAYRRGSKTQVNWSYRGPPKEEADRKEEASEAADLVSDKILKDVMNDVE